MEDVNSRDIIFALLFATAYFIILFTPFFVYAKNFFSNSEGDKKIAIELVANAFILQVFVLIVFGVLSIILENVAVSGLSGKPSYALELFFGDSQNTVWSHWLMEVNKLTSSTEVMIDGTELSEIGVIIGGIVYLTVFFYMICLSVPILFLVYSAIGFLRDDTDKQSSAIGSTPMSVTFSYVMSAVGFMMIIWLHSRIAFTYPHMFLEVDGALGYDFYNSMRAAWSELTGVGFYKNGSYN